MRGLGRRKGRVGIPEAGKHHRALGREGGEGDMVKAKEKRNV